MNAIRARLPIFAAALWWGSLTAIGFMAVPLLFANASAPAVAGNLAAKLFTGQTWLSLACGMLLLFTSRPEPHDDEEATRPNTGAACWDGCSPDCCSTC